MKYKEGISVLSESFMKKKRKMTQSQYLKIYLKKTFQKLKATHMYKIGMTYWNLEKLPRMILKDRS